MILRLLAFVFLVLALGSLAGDAWASYSSGLPFSLRSLEASWMATSPSTLSMAQNSWPGITGILPYPAVAVLGVLGMLTLLPTIFLRQRH
jgi:hypothetical protein